jgi:hypothetical protein
MINIFEKLLPIEISTGIKIYEDSCDDMEEKYIVFTIEGEQPIQNGDDKVLADTIYVTLQLIVPKRFDYVETKYKIRDLLEDNEFSVTDIHSYANNEINGTDKIRRIIFETNITVNH